ncbi:MAG TPA: hypothetical protein VND23_02740 [Acidimicrobiales bacterium]|nr:hypothetical protein [Acidimicrobiales bacterium]
MVRVVLVLVLVLAVTVDAITHMRSATQRRPLERDGTPSGSVHPPA